MINTDRYDLAKELSTLTQVPPKTVQKFLSVSIDVISHGVAEGREKGQSQSEFDLGYGYLKIEYTDEVITYKFLPDRRLQQAVLNASKYGASALEVRAEESLVKKIKETYTELL